MEKWFKICLLLCLFGLLKEMRPSEPFLTEYLVGPWKNLTSEEVSENIFNLSIYIVRRNDYFYVLFVLHNI